MNTYDQPFDDLKVDNFDRIPWEDKHSELINKLKSDNNTSQEDNLHAALTRFQQFNIAGLDLLASEEHAPEILDDNIVYPLLLTPEWVLGTCNVRGKIVPIFDLEKVLYPDVSIAKATNYKTLIIHEGDYVIGLPLFELPVLVHMDEEECISKFNKIPQLIEPFVKKAYKKNKNMTFLLNYSALFAYLKSQYIAP